MRLAIFKAACHDTLDIYMWK